MVTNTLWSKLTKKTHVDLSGDLWKELWDLDIEVLNYRKVTIEETNPSLNNIKVYLNRSNKDKYRIIIFSDVFVFVFQFEIIFIFEVIF